jgi:hypothetical protein
MTGPAIFLAPQSYATVDEVDAITDGMIACARQLRHLGARIPVPQRGWRLSCNVANLEALRRYAEDLGIEVTEHGGHYRAVLPLAPGFSYVLWAESA